MKIVDKIADWLDAFDELKNRSKSWYLSENTQKIIVVVMFFILLSAVFNNLYQAGFSWYWYFIPIIMIAFLVFLILGKITQKERKINIKVQEKIHAVETIGVNFNRTILDNLFHTLKNMDKIDIEKTGIDDFYNVLTLPFDNHNSEIYFVSITWGELRYVLKKFKKRFGTGYAVFEASKKIYRKEQLITAKAISNNGLRTNPEKYFMQRIDNCLP